MLRTPTRVIVESISSPSASSTSANSVVAARQVIVEAERRALGEVEARGRAPERAAPSARAASRGRAARRGCRPSSGARSCCMPLCGRSSTTRLTPTLAVASSVSRRASAEASSRSAPVCEVRLPERFAARRPELRQRAARVDADLARAGLGVQLLADAEAGFLLAHVRCEVEPLRDVLDLGEIGRRVAGAADRRTPSARARRALRARRSAGSVGRCPRAACRRASEPSLTSVAPSSSLSPASRAVARAPAVVPPASTSSVSYSATMKTGLNAESRLGTGCLNVSSPV